MLVSSEKAARTVSIRGCSRSCKMLSEYLPFTCKYFYHILTIAVIFVLFNKCVEWLVASNGTLASTDDDDSTDPSESNESHAACRTYPYMRIVWNTIVDYVYFILENERTR